MRRSGPAGAPGNPPAGLTAGSGRRRESGFAPPRIAWPFGKDHLGSASAFTSDGALRIALASIAVATVGQGGAHAGVTDLGTYQTSVGVEVPEFHGIIPTIRLVYDSNAGNRPLGIGWSLHEGSQITHTSQSRGVPNYESSDQLRLGAMELISCATASTSVSCKSGGTHTTRAESFYLVPTALL
jgi:Salmonella virulence plasmid 65kDa B protein